MISSKKTICAGLVLGACGLALGLRLMPITAADTPAGISSGVESTAAMPTSSAPQFISRTTPVAVSAFPSTVAARPLAEPVTSGGTARISSDRLQVGSVVRTISPGPEKPAMHTVDSVAVKRHAAFKSAARSSTGFAPLLLPALADESGMLDVSAVTIPAVLAVADTRVALDSAQRTALEALADDFAEQAGAPPADLSDKARSTFAVDAYIAATKADFLIKQRYGHRAFVQMQMEAARAMYSR